jgi:hypothetical protein
MKSEQRGERLIAAQEPAVPVGIRDADGRLFAGILEKRFGLLQLVAGSDQFGDVRDRPNEAAAAVDGHAVLSVMAQLAARRRGAVLEAYGARVLAEVGPVGLQRGLVFRVHMQRPVVDGLAGRKAKDLAVGRVGVGDVARGISAVDRHRRAVADAAHEAQPAQHSDMRCSAAGEREQCAALAVGEPARHVVHDSERAEHPAICVDQGCAGIEPGGRGEAPVCGRVRDLEQAALAQRVLVEPVMNRVGGRVRGCAGAAPAEFCIGQGNRGGRGLAQQPGGRGQFGQGVGAGALRALRRCHRHGYGAHSDHHRPRDRIL